MYFAENGYLDTPLIVRRFEDLVLQIGIPDIYRGKLWQFCSGSMYSMCIRPGYYSDLRNSEHDEDTLSEIDRDLHRSLPKHPFYQTPQGIIQLRNVLISYSKRNPSIGYCQAMNIIAATLLLYNNEEEAFWLLAEICENIVPDYYAKGLELMGTIIDQQIFTGLVEAYLPQIKNHLDKIGIPVGILTLPWFMCLFIGYLPWDASMRILDCVLWKGKKVLFQIGLAILDMRQEEILKAKEGQSVTQLFKDGSFKTKDIFKVSFSKKYNSLPMHKISEMRNAQQFAYMSGLQRTTTMKKLRQIQKGYPKLKLNELESLFRQFAEFAPVTDKEEINRSIDVDSFKHILFAQLPALRDAFESDDTEKKNLIDALSTLIFENPEKVVEDEMSFIELVDVMNIVARGTLLEQFHFCLDLIYKDIDEIRPSELEEIFDFLYSLSYDGDLCLSQNKHRLYQLVNTIFDDKDVLTTEQLFEQLENDNLLETYWTQLYFPV
eukprot:TRINITY_DN1811_c0_g1_i1.p1 TRINITY_DN1811_c0_g1~~TRINITY_DN1811_c0_g1_i1.p1  ORF type:complete len:491 (+),score=97.74 TRINITY_DN1811_c0_g1_i1:1298-2770(+)